MGRYAKAFVAALAAVSGSLVTALADDSISAGEWVVAVLAGLGALGVTWVVPNRPADPEL